MSKIGPKFSQIVSVRLEGGDPPPKAVSLTAFSQFFLTPPLSKCEKFWSNFSHYKMVK